jgi:hypothetical protein
MNPGGILVLAKETEGAIEEEDPCCVSALLGWFSNAPVLAVGSTLHAIASTASSRSVLPLTLLRACFWTRGTERESLLPVCPCKSRKPSLLFARVNNLVKCRFCSCGEELLLGSAAEDKSEREEESSSLLEGGFLPARPVAAREGEREESKLELLEVVILMLGASSAAEEEEEESELADLPCLDKGLEAFFFFFSFLSLLALELLGILV